MLITIGFLFLVVLLGSFIILRIKRQEGQATPRRHHEELSLKRETILDADDALGLKQASTMLSEKKQTPVTPAKQEKSEPAKTQGPLDYIVLHILAPQERPYNGYELLQALLANGLRYGDMNIFHRHETKTGRGKVLFSLASINKPGTFELQKMGNFSCPGLTLFMVLKDQPDMMLAFDTMLDTAKQLAEDLGGEVRDERRHVLNAEKILLLRARIRKVVENRIGPVVPDFLEEDVASDWEG